MAANIKLACILCGLPARGKTFISYKISRYLQWLGIHTKVFDEVEYYEKMHGSNNTSYEFLNIQNNNKHKIETSATLAHQTIDQVLNDLIQWIDHQHDLTNGNSQGGGGVLGDRVAIYDGANLTSYKRKYLYDTLITNNIQVLFIESLCDDESLIRQNIRDVKLFNTIITNNDNNNNNHQHSIKKYEEKEQEQAIDHYIQRIETKYQPIYESLDDNNEEANHYTYIKLINAGNQYVINLVHGYLESRIVYYLMNLNIKKKQIWLSRHGESVFNVEDKIGGNADLSPRGQLYAKKLPDLIEKHVGNELPLTVWTSTLKRTIQTASNLKFPKKQWKALDELDTGVCDGMTYDEIAEKYPDDFLKRDEDKFNYRYRGGESYRDLVLRLEPVIMELEQHERILIIAHQATIRCLYAYFMNLNYDQLPYARVPLHTLIELTPTAYHCDEKLYKVDIEAVDTYRPKSAGVENVLLKSPTAKNFGAMGEIANTNSML
ncbi:histidine phosphatase superfamily [Cunninghamella echinulata]|nr:histidine phosphatase superfamily [Cunninghamella echinulata]